MKTLSILAALGVALTSTSAMAAQVLVTSYDTPNGNGTTVGGSYNYWDLSYSGSGSTTVDGAPLTGGTGDLTDGVFATDVWNAVENGAGTGPYVGWYIVPTPNPLLTFNFAGGSTITDIAIHLDNSLYGGVAAPASILIDGINTAFTAPTAGTIGTVTFAGLNLTGNSHTIQFQQAPGTWTFVSEVQFFDNSISAVPEPASWAMMIGGFGLIGGAMRRRSQAALTAA